MANRPDKKPILLRKDLAALGRNIRAEREKRGMTKEQLAKAAGIEPVTLGNVEYGEHYWPSMPVFLKINRALGVAEPELVRP